MISLMNGVEKRNYQFWDSEGLHFHTGLNTRCAMMHIAAFGIMNFSSLINLHSSFCLKAEVIISLRFCKFKDHNESNQTT